MATPLIPLTAADLSEYLTSTSDFALEVEIYRACVSAGFKSEHGGTYLDQNSKKDRQFDVRATALLKKERVVKLAIECKNLKASHPILVCRIPRSDSEAHHQVLITFRDETRPSVCQPCDCGIGHSPYLRDKQVGKSIKHVARANNKGEFSDKDSEIYDKWSQAIASCAAWLKDSFLDFELVGSNAASTVFLPILVVSDGALWTVDFDSDGRQLGDPTSTDSCEFFIGKTVDIFPTSYGISHLHIYTKSGLLKQLSRLTSNDHHIDLWFPEFAKYHGRKSSQQ